jgi:hypothetical protein
MIFSFRRRNTDYWRVLKKKSMSYQWFTRINEEKEFICRFLTVYIQKKEGDINFQINSEILEEYYQIDKLMHSEDFHMFLETNPELDTIMKRNRGQIHWKDETNMFKHKTMKKKLPYSMRSRLEKNHEMAEYQDWSPVTRFRKKKYKVMVEKSKRKAFGINNELSKTIPWLWRI